jgi:hypothetical protein
MVLIVYVPQGNIIQNTLFCPHSVGIFVGFVWILEKTVIVSLYTNNRFAFKNEGSVFTARCELNGYI